MMTMMQFLPYGADVSGALPQSYSVLLVILSYLIAALAAYAGLQMSVCIANAESAWSRWIWLSGGSVAMGIGIWAMHFTGMLALTLPIPVSYNVPATGLSVVPAILASVLALRVMSGPGNRHRRYLIAGALVGVGIGAMHYIGMASLRIDAMQGYSHGLFVVSLIVAVLLGIAAMYTHELRHVLGNAVGENVLILLGAGLMGLATAGMHYTAMAAVCFIPNSLNGSTGVTVDKFWLSIGVTVIGLTIILLAIVAAVVGKLFQTTARRTRVDRERIVDAIESLTDGFTLYDDKGNLTICNTVLRKMYPALAKLLTPGASYKDLVAAWANSRGQFPGGVGAEAYIAESLRSLTEAGHISAPKEERLTDGRWVYIRDHSVDHGGLATVFTDVTPIKELQGFYERQAAQDALTGLVSRRMFDDRVDHAIALAKRLKKSVSLLYVDLDAFKPINDSFGHEAGDAVLKEVASRLRKAARESDTVARLGGDEFGVLMESDNDQTGAGTLATRIIDAISQPIFVGGHECHVGASVGIAILSPGTVDREALMRAADEAMYEAKKAGTNRYRIHADLLVDSLGGPVDLLI
jgi:diguanylate cyclase (GGDEF)-like protein